jgi:hypothetical protein
MIKISSLFLSLLIPWIGHAQWQRCATDQYALMTGCFAKAGGESSLSSVQSIDIPVVVHIIYKEPEQNLSDEQIQSQLDVLNEDFSASGYYRYKIPEIWKGLAEDSQIRFHLALRDPSGNPTTGITRTLTWVDEFQPGNQMKFFATGGHDTWPDTAYLNIWVCNLANNMLGFAQYPGGNPATDGIVIHYRAFGRIGNLLSKYNRGRTATHEVGHWLNLLHIWGDADCGNDFISDTPVQKTSTSGCPSYPKVSCCAVGGACNAPHGDMFMNFMDYTDDRCMMLFTRKQCQRMANAIQQYRPAFFNATAHQPVSLPSLDLKINRILNPSGLICRQMNIPEVEVINSGATTVHAFSLEAGLVHGVTLTTTWTGHLHPGDTLHISFSSPLSVAEGEGLAFARLTSTDDFNGNNFLTSGYLRANGEYGCDRLSENPSIVVYPNPVSQLLTIRASFKLTPQVTVMITDCSGRVLQQQVAYQAEDFILTVNSSALSSGLYLVYVMTAEGRAATRFVKIND